jgi:hypothetical protein
MRRKSEDRLTCMTMKAISKDTGGANDLNNSKITYVIPTLDDDQKSASEEDEDQSIMIMVKVLPLLLAFLLFGTIALFCNRLVPRTNSAVIKARAVLLSPS